MDFFQIVEWTTIFVTFGMMLSGIPPCVKMYQTKQTKSVPLPFFLVCLMNSLIAVFYGTLISNTVLKVINTVGSALWCLYTLIYISVTRDQGSAVKKLLAMFAVFGAQIVYLVYVVQDQQLIVDKLGSLLFFWSNIMVLTPVLEILEVVKTKNVDGVPVSMLIGGLVCCSAWFLYGYLLNDVNIYGPNIVGNIVNLIRLGLLVAYSGNKTKIQ